MIDPEFFLNMGNITLYTNLFDSVLKNSMFVIVIFHVVQVYYIVIVIISW